MTSASSLWMEIQEFDAAARQFWEKKDKALRKLVKAAKLGRKTTIVVPLSESRGLRITDEFRAKMRSHEDKLFAPAFARRYEVKEVPLS